MYGVSTQKRSTTTSGPRKETFPTVADDLRCVEVDATRLVCNMLVVCIHMGIILGALGSSAEISAWRYFSQVVAPVSLPLLFMLSGYLRFSPKWSLNSWKVKLPLRVKGILLPYIAWNVLYLGVAIVTVIIGVESAPTGVNGMGGWLAWGGSKILHPIAPPADMPLWYMRTLVAYLLLSPIFACFFRIRNCVLMVVAFAAFWGVYAWGYERTVPPAVYQYCYPPYSLGAFFLGGVMAFKGVGFSRLCANKWIFLLGVCAFILPAKFSMPQIVAEIFRVTSAFAVFAGVKI